MKTCFKCSLAKPLTEFYRHPAMNDGHLGKCKECAKADSLLHRSQNIERIRLYDRTRGRKANPAYISEYQERYPERRAAHIAVGNALRDGRITALPCLICGDDAQAHHPDYSAPLDVVWLCPIHHKETHEMARKAA